MLLSLRSLWERIIAPLVPDHPGTAHTTIIPQGTTAISITLRGSSAMTVTRRGDCTVTMEPLE